MNAIDSVTLIVAIILAGNFLQKRIRAGEQATDQPAASENQPQ